MLFEIKTDPMETQANNPVGEGSPAVASTPPPALTPLDIIRTETVLSKLPIHNLSKKGRVNIQILKTTPNGQVELKWEVSYSDRYGQARQLAYKLDTIVIDQTIEEAGRPLPERLCLGSLRDIADQLDLGGDTNKVRRALRQNASAFITAKFKYKANDGTERILEADFTRYSVVFTGEKFPDGSRADAVYILLNPPYRDVLNNAPMRPLDLGYKKQLSPAAQRFYEIVSYKIFAAIKNSLPVAKLSYSEYCTFSAQQRYFVREQFRKQMFKIHEAHKRSGYIASVDYDDVTDAQGQPDWIMKYVPGPKARNEYDTFTGKKPKTKTIDAAATTTAPEMTEGESDSPAAAPYRTKQRKLRIPSTRRPPAPVLPTPIIDYQMVAELGKRGVGEIDARAVLATLQPGQPILDQLEYADYQIKYSRTKIDNPPGFYISCLQRNVSIPSTFETSSARKKRQEAEFAQREALLKQEATAAAAEEQQRQELDAQIASLPDPARLALHKQAKAELIREFPNLAGYFKLHPKAESEDGALRARMRSMLKTGWRFEPPAQKPPQPASADQVTDQLPHQAINAPPAGSHEPASNPEQGTAEKSVIQPVVNQPHVAPLSPVTAIDLQAILSTPQLPPATGNVKRQATVSPAPSKVDDHLL